MNCRLCYSKTKVVDSKSYMHITIRRRKCKKCHAEFWTLEGEVPVEKARQVSNQYKLLIKGFDADVVALIGEEEEHG